MSTHNIARLFEREPDRRHRFVFDRPLDLAPELGVLTTAPELARVVRETAGRLVAAGARKGDRIAILKENHLDFLMLAAAAARIGCLPGLLSAGVPARRVRVMLERFRPDLVVATSSALTALGTAVDGPAAHLVLDDGAPGFDGPVRRLAEFAGATVPAPDPVAEHEPMICTHTSGTTGVPKLVLHSARTGAQLHGRLESLPLAPWSPRASDVCVSATGFMHVRNLAWLRGQLARRPRETVVLSRTAFADVAPVLRDHRPTIVEAFPNTFQAWEQDALRNPDIFALVRMFITTFDAVHPRTIETFLGLSRHRLPVWGHGWAQSETGPIAFSLHTRGSITGGPARRTQQFRFPAPGARFRTVAAGTGRDVPPGEPGQLLIRTRGLCLEYVGEAERHDRKLQPDGWSNTGDLAIKHRGGTLELVDREVDELPGESTIGLESILLDRLGCASEVVVLAQQDGDPLPVVAGSDPELVRAGWARAAAGLPPMRPPVVLAWDEIPRTATMKVRRADLREQLTGAQQGIGTGRWT